MADSSDNAGRLGALMGDASLDQETKSGIENQINSDSGSSLGSSLKDMISGDSSSSDSASSSSSGGDNIQRPSADEEIPTGLDAIKASGPQKSEERYSV